MRRSARELTRATRPKARHPAPAAPRSYGTYHYLDGSRYEGSWIDDRIEGKGTSYYANGNVFTGEFIDGRINGQGHLKYADGDEYVGSFVDGKMEGEVRLTAD